ncbi:MAG TPA: hypothetical protein PKK43_16200, partial [Spirochaetota bacterium]|nr:hypothetical protein [Spirochaetota bacterium]
INCPEFNTDNGIRDINDLMDEAFTRYITDGIEIDLRTVPSNPSYKGVYVSHDAIESVIMKHGHEAARAYLSRNSINQVLEHFIERGYDISGHGIFMELKVPRKHLFSNNTDPDESDMEYLRKSFETVNAIVNDVRDPARRKSLVAHLGFISFNPYALKAIHDMDHSGYELHFLAATNRPIGGRFAALLDDELNFLNGSITEFLTHADWLDGIWFDPRGIDNAAEVFNSINDRRKIKTGIYLFTFKLEYGELKKRLASYVYEDEASRKKRTLENVRSLMFDIRRSADPDAEGACE